MNEIIQGDCIEVMKTLPKNSVDAIVTDPPYGLSFMGKKWDYDVPSLEVWQECLRVLKPGGYLLSFAGTRTQHRMAVRIEDAGFEIRDMIAWVYGSGFPKSLNIGKAVSKIMGEEVKQGTAFKTAGEYGGRNLKDPTPINDREQFRHRPQTEEGKQWEGWGTALKPSLEPITVARKPLAEKTVAENCLKWGTGGINIDECRVGTTGARNNGNSKGTIGSNSIGVYGKAIKQDYNMGRFPANLIHDGSDEVVGLFPNTKSGDLKKGTFCHQENNNIKWGDREIFEDRIGDSGSASRFFYCAKSSKSERNMGCEGLEDKEWKLNHLNGGDKLGLQGSVEGVSKNNHPTVKPIALMEYLIKLVSKEGAIILDPFAGSGTTCIAAKNLNRKFIGIEKEPEYVSIANARLTDIQPALL